MRNQTRDTGKGDTKDPLQHHITISGNSKALLEDVRIKLSPLAVPLDGAYDLDPMLHRF